MALRTKLARLILRAGAKLAWWIGGRAAFGRWLLAEAVRYELAVARTAGGPEGDGGDHPDGPVEPLLGAIEIAIPPTASARARAVRWWCEERKRADEAFLFDRADAIQAALIAPGGLLRMLEAQLAGIEEAMGYVESRADST